MFCAGLALALIVAALLTRSVEVRTLVLVLSLYFALSFFSELLGVALAGHAISFPRRVLKMFPLPVLLRRSLNVSDIYVIYSFSSPGLQRCTVATFQGGRETIYFPDRDAKYAFFSSLNSVNREIKIVRIAN
ncbi:hypothetical protein WOC76_08955 [Methylocystis sp. IM3]|jgi:hypothetical protein|uniref:hypothetical protein n=1 Tax=unclassified Methylocystis TaxID=2625913 RepID=UPI0030F86356